MPTKQAFGGAIPSIGEIERERYTASEHFLELARSNKAEGVFVTPVIEACFEGRTAPTDDEKEHTALLLGELHECEFGLVVDYENEAVITGHVYFVNGVKAYESGVWDAETIDRMRDLRRRRNPYTGNKREWYDADFYQKTHYDGTHPRFS